MRVLAVDDDDSVLEILGMLVTKAGFHDVVTASGAGEALERITVAKEPFDCILLDIQMPGMDGVEFCDLLRRLPDYADCRIIMVTAMTDRIFMEQAFDAGADDYVTKPFDVNELAARLHHATTLIN